MHRTICDFLLDIIQNSIEADSSAVIVHISQDESLFEVTAADDGCGMSEEDLKRVQDPFFSGKGKHDHRKAGLGIPFLAQTVSMTGGQFDIQSRQGTGTSVRFVLPLDHVDTPPVGDLPGTFLSALSYPGSFEMIICRSLSAGGQQDSYQLVRSELMEALGDLHLSGSLSVLREYLASQETSMKELLEK